MSLPLFLLLLATPSAEAAAQDRTQQIRDFQTASERALSGDLAGAITLYEHLEDSGVRHPDLYYDLGQTYAKAGMMVDAVVSFERVLRLDPADEDARANLDLIRAKLRPAARGELPEEPASVAEVIEPLIATLPQDGTAIALLFFDVLAFGLLIVARFAPKTQRFLRFLIAPAFAGLIILTVLVAGQEVVRRDPRAVITATSPMKEGPHERFGENGDVYAGERVRIRDEEEGWIQVQNEAGVRGWLPALQAVRF